MRRVLARVIQGLALVALAVSFVGGRLAVSDVFAYRVTLPGGTPVVVYEPGEPRGFGESPPGDRLPTVVLAHGFASNASLMAQLARRIARSGYAVLTFDFRGHGRNPARFAQLREGRGGLVEDVGAVVEYARAHPRLDGTRLAVAGHSMGAGAVMRYAAFESGLAAVIGISGGTDPEGAYPVQNLLLIWAEGDPDRIRLWLRELGARQAGLERLVVERTYGEIARGDATRLSEVPGASHATMVYSSVAADRILDWLGRSLGPGVVARSAPLDEPALPFALLGIAALGVLLFGLPSFLSRAFSAQTEARPVTAPLPETARFLASLAGALLLLYPSGSALFSGVSGLLPFVASSELVVFLAVSGTIHWVLLARSRERARASSSAGSWRRDCAAALVCFAFSFLALGGVLSPYMDVSLDPERVAWGLACAGLTLPFFLSTERALRGVGAAGVWLPVAAKVVLVLTLGTAAALELLPGVILLALGGIAALLVLLEWLAQRLGRTGFDPRVAALFQAFWIGQMASTFPIA